MSGFNIIIECKNKIENNRNFKYFLYLLFRKQQEICKKKKNDLPNVPTSPNLFLETIPEVDDLSNISDRKVV